MVAHDVLSGSKALSSHAWASVFPSAKWGDSTCSEDRQAEQGVFQGCGEPWKREFSYWLPMAPRTLLLGPSPSVCIAMALQGAILNL